jgi:hypothetical protein
MAIPNVENSPLEELNQQLNGSVLPLILERGMINESSRLGIGEGLRINLQKSSDPKISS